MNSDKVFNISGKVAIITGGGGVLGGNIADSLAKQGLSIVILDLRKEQIEKKVDDITKAGGRAYGYQCNVLDVKSLEEARDKILADCGKIDILINAAGGNTPKGSLSANETVFDMDIEAFKFVNELNLTGTVMPSIVFGKALADAKSGCIINISSMATYSALTRVLGYSTAKSGVNIFTKWMANEMASKFSDKIRVNAIAPGFFIGDQNRDLLINPDGTYTDRSKKVLAKTPMNRFGDISELNGIVHFLASNEASFITGAIIPVDGGFSAFSGV
ncbi:MAG: SDR family oxidoreductase [Bacteroidales bacterium]